VAIRAIRPDQVSQQAEYLEVDKPIEIRPLIKSSGPQWSGREGNRDPQAISRTVQLCLFLLMANLVAPLACATAQGGASPTGTSYATPQGPAPPRIATSRRIIGTRLRFEIDPRRHGEMPRTMLIAQDGMITATSGATDLTELRTWIAAQRDHKGETKG
jgi:hypothetical protein